MTLKIYGSPRSRTMRTLWIAEELQLDYEHIPVAWDDPWLKTPEFLQINPAGTVPTIDHDGFGLGESLAINMYLAKTFGSDKAEALYPKEPKNEAQAWRWTLWAQAHLEPWVRQDGGLPVYTGQAADVAKAEAHDGLRHLEKVLDTRSWLVGHSFSIADLNVACVMSPSRVAPLDMAPYANTREWLRRCYSRPAAQSSRGRFAS